MRTWRIVKTTIATLSMGLLAGPMFAAAQYGPAAQGPAAQYDANGTNTTSLQNGPAQYNQQPLPGTLNYLEGVAYLNGQQLTQKDVGSVTMQAGQELRTSEGRVEILLDPGVYLRVDNDSAVKMIKPELTPTVVAVEHGRAGVEVDNISRNNTLLVIDNGVRTQLVKTGYYEFNANSPTAKVFKGQAEVEYRNGKWEKVKGDHELALLPGEHNRTQKFHASPQEDQLMAWSKLRSQELAQANNQIASDYEGYPPGWFWDPYFPGYTYLGMSPFYSPFGWGFYPMGWGMGMGWGGWGWGPGYYGGGYYGRGYYGGRDFDGDHDMNRGMRAVGNGRFQGGAGTGFRGGAGFHGGGMGGFHGGGMGGFHGGGMGGFHGGGGMRR
jgi:hypothetical protein